MEDEAHFERSAGAIGRRGFSFDTRVSSEMSSLRRRNFEDEIYRSYYSCVGQQSRSVYLESEKISDYLSTPRATDRLYEFVRIKYINPVTICRPQLSRNTQKEAPRAPMSGSKVISDNLIALSRNAYGRTSPFAYTQRDMITRMKRSGIMISASYRAQRQRRDSAQRYGYVQDSTHENAEAPQRELESC